MRSEVGKLRIEPGELRFQTLNVITFAAHSRLLPDVPGTTFPANPGTALADATQPVGKTVV